MKNYSIFAHASLLACVMAVAPLAHAALSVSGSEDTTIKGAVPTLYERGESEGSVEVGARGERETKSELRSDDSVEMSTGTVEFRANAKGGKDEEFDAGHSTGTERGEEMSDERERNMLEKTELHLRLESEVKNEGSSGEIRSRSEVRTQTDLEQFIQFSAKDDDHLKRVDIQEGSVEVEYAQPARLLGIFKMTLPARVSVDAKNNVEVSYPWYRIFMKKDVSQASLQSNIARALAGEKKLLAEGMATTTAQSTISSSLGIVDIFDIIVRTLKESRLAGTATTSLNTY